MPKFGKVKYGTVKYGIYNISQGVVTGINYSPSTKFRMKTSKGTFVAQNIICENANKIKVNGIVGQLINVDGAYSKVRVKGNRESQWTIAKGVE